MGQTLDSFSKGIEFTQSHRPEDAIPDSYDKCEPGFTLICDHEYLWRRLLKLVATTTAFTRNVELCYIVSDSERFYIFVFPQLRSFHTYTQVKV